MLYAADGLGCHLNGRPCRVSATQTLTRGIVSFTNAASFKAAQREAAWQRILGHRLSQRRVVGRLRPRLGRLRRLELMLDPVMNPYDCGPFPVILREAGGYFGDWSGRETIYANEALSTTGNCCPRSCA